MIELRWLEKPFIIRVSSEGEEVRLEKVLQYRQQIEVPGGKSGAWVTRWSDWRDVPTVKE